MYLQSRPLLHVRPRRAGCYGYRTHKHTHTHSVIMDKFIQAELFPTRLVTHLLRSLWMMGWVRLCRYSMPLATSMAMMSLDCRSMSLSIDTSLKRQPLSSRINGLCQSHAALYADRWSGPQKTAPGRTVSLTLRRDQWWSPGQAGLVRGSFQGG